MVVASIFLEGDVRILLCSCFAGTCLGVSSWCCCFPLQRVLVGSHDLRGVPTDLPLMDRLLLCSDYRQMDFPVAIGSPSGR